MSRTDQTSSSESSSVEAVFSIKQLFSAVKNVILEFMTLRTSLILTHHIYYLKAENYCHAT